MKKLFIIMLSVGLTVAAFGQGHGSGGHGSLGGHVIAPVHVGVGFGYGMHPSYGYWGYNPWYAFPSYGYAQPQSKLDLKIEQIKLDYNDRIWSVKHDKNLSGKERRQTVRSLKTQREKDILDAKINYYQSASRK